MREWNNDGNGYTTRLGLLRLHVDKHPGDGKRLLPGWGWRLVFIDMGVPTEIYESPVEVLPSEWGEGTLKTQALYGAKQLLSSWLQEAP